MIPIKILPQPNDSTCGPTSLHAVYRYYGDKVSLESLIREVPSLEGGGTFAVMLANHALKQGYRATIYTCNLNLFDPTWDFKRPDALMEKLKAQRKLKHNRKLGAASDAYEEFLQIGGRVKFEELKPALLKKYLGRGVPILTGLSATYLYKCRREYDGPEGKSIYDDVKGAPVGHFVVLCGFESTNRVVVADPFKGNPMAPEQYYTVSARRLIHSILLGIVTYDANLLIIERS